MPSCKRMPRNEPFNVSDRKVRCFDLKQFLIGVSSAKIASLTFAFEKIVQNSRDAIFFTFKKQDFG